MAINPAGAPLPVTPTRPPGSTLPGTVKGAGDLPTDYSAFVALGVGWSGFSGLPTGAALRNTQALEGMFPGLGATPGPAFDPKPFERLGVTFDIRAFAPPDAAGLAPSAPLPKDMEAALKKQMAQYEKAMKAATGGATGYDGVFKALQAGNKQWRQLLGLPG